MTVIKKVPGSYVERIKGVRTANDLPSTSVGGIVGQTARGVANTPIKLTSWSQFEEKFAKGISDPFAFGNVADAVYGFFLNGGTEVYVVRTLESGSKKATAKIPSESGVTFTAKEEGEWGNDITITIAQEQQLSRQLDTFSLVVTIDGNKVEEIKKIGSDNFVTMINENSDFITVENDGTFAVGSGTLASGSEEAHTSATYNKGVSCFDTITDINLLAVPGITEEGVQENLVSYCDTRGDVFPIIADTDDATIEGVLKYKDKITSSHLGGMYYPNVIIMNPLTGVKKKVSACGHIMGTIARTDAERGVHKAPAGLDATLKGVIAVDTALSETEIGILNDAEVNCILPKKGSGIVIWGARMLKVDGERSYVSDIRLDIFVEQAVKINTEWATFEPKDSKLFNDVTAQLSGLLLGMWEKGMFLGDTKEDAFYVKCDGELNPNINSPELIIEIGYAKKKPAEFVVTRITSKQ